MAKRRILILLLGVVVLVVATLTAVRGQQSGTIPPPTKAGDLSKSSISIMVINEAPPLEVRQITKAYPCSKVNEAPPKDSFYRRHKCKPRFFKKPAVRKHAATFKKYKEVKHAKACITVKPVVKGVSQKDFNDLADRVGNLERKVNKHEQQINGIATELGRLMAGKQKPLAKPQTPKPQVKPKPTPPTTPPAAPTQPGPSWICRVWQAICGFFVAIWGWIVSYHFLLLAILLVIIVTILLYKFWDDLALLLARIWDFGRALVKSTQLQFSEGYINITKGEDSRHLHAGSWIKSDWNDGDMVEVRQSMTNNQDQPIPISKVNFPKANLKKASLVPGSGKIKFADVPEIALEDWMVKEGFKLSDLLEAPQNLSPEEAVVFFYQVVAKKSP